MRGQRPTDTTVKFLLGQKGNPAEFQETKISKPIDRYDFGYFHRQDLTALNKAAFHGNLEMIELLAKRQSWPPDPANPHGRWPFIIDKTYGVRSRSVTWGFFDFRFPNEWSLADTIKTQLVPSLRFFSDIPQKTPETVHNAVPRATRSTYIPEPES